MCGCKLCEICTFIKLADQVDRRGLGVDQDVASFELSVGRTADLFLIGCVAAIRSRSLIRIDALPQIFTFLTKPLALVSHLAVLVFSGIMIYLGWEMTMMMYQDEYARTATLRLPEWPFYAVLPLMGVMMMFRTLITIWEDIIDRQEITGDN